MFRRIEFIGQLGAEDYRTLIHAAQLASDESKSYLRFWKTGIMGSQPPMFDAWSHMNAPRRAIYKNCRFYFTEEGWRRLGRATITACQQTG